MTIALALAGMGYVTWIINFSMDISNEESRAEEGNREETEATDFLLHGQYFSFPSSLDSQFSLVGLYIPLLHKAMFNEMSPKAWLTGSLKNESCWLGQNCSIDQEMVKASETVTRLPKRSLAVIYLWWLPM